MNTRELALIGLSFIICHLSFSTAGAQKHVTRSTMIGYGPTRVLDTYLSAEHFRGDGLSFVSTVERQRPGRRWTTLIEHEANVATLKDRARSQQEIEGAYNVYWGRLYGWQLLGDRLRLQAGGVVNGTLGFIYNTSNGNNPAQARAHISLMPTGAADYRFRLFGKQFSARYELMLPLAGITFSPNYGQSYYEIFSLGDYDHNAVPVTFVSAPEWRHMLTLDARLWRNTQLRIGYLGNMQQQRVNHLRQHVYTHRFLVGITKHFAIKPL